MEHKVTILEGDCDLTDDIGPEYDLANMKLDIERTEKYRALARARMIRLDPDIVAFFKTPEAINEALRRVMQERQPAA
jgi:hypothetical protein